LNEIMDFDILTDKQGNMAMRIHLLGTSNASMVKIKEGLSIAARKLLQFQERSEGSALRKVDWVVMTSWLIFEHPEIFEKKLKFTLLPRTEQDQAAGVTRAHMPRDEFIKEYLKAPASKEVQG
jgi:hypothetical protein